ncbi:MAG: hypothetical protein LC775_00925 [Acidobacteria bacterium]|nr:hypothetical protein [Acidobacteriota bacterium]
MIAERLGRDPSVVCRDIPGMAAGAGTGRRSPPEPRGGLPVQTKIRKLDPEHGGAHAQAGRRHDVTRADSSKSAQQYCHHAGRRECGASSRRGHVLASTW